LLDLVASIAEGALIATGSYYMALTIPVTVVIIYILQKFYLNTSRQLRILELETRGPVYSHFLETLEGLVTIRAFKWESRVILENLDRLDKSQQPYYLMFCIQRWLALVLDLIVAGLATTVVALATTLRYSTNPGLVGVSMNALLSFNQTIAAFLTGWTILETSLGAIVRLRNLETDVLPEDEAKDPLVPNYMWPAQGLIELRNVSASYGSTLALEDISFMIRPGQTFTICGRTGSGKSSLLSTLLRTLPINNGSITIDSVPIKHVPLSILRRRVITIPQDTVFLPGTVRLNLDPFNYQLESDTISALKKVGLWSLFEERGGLSTELDATTLSKGQQQLFALARAMLQYQVQRSAVVLMDEGMSSVDADTERIIQEILTEEFKTCTVVCIAHRMETILRADVVAVLDGGKIVELGNPKDLMEKKNSRLKSLVSGKSSI
jgi:ATP-binding cassette subfamily C (CFTR/MRP) protein 1